MKHLICSILLLFLAIKCSADIKLSDFSLVRSFQSNSGVLKPALVSFTIPDEKENSFLINAAVGIDISSLFFDRDKKLVKIYPNIEYNRNTLIDKDQDQLNLGLAFKYIVLNSSTFIPTFTSSAKYSNDYIKEIKSFQGEIFIAPIWTGVNTSINNFFVPGNLVKIGKIGFEYIPCFGLEVEMRNKAEKDSLIGDIYRFVFKLESNLYLYPKCDSTGKFQYHYIEVGVDYNYRSEISNSTEDFLSNNNFFKCSVNYTIFKYDNLDAKVGLDYVWGANPNKAFEDQNYYGLSIKLKI